jgi:hypothetical protein
VSQALHGREGAMDRFVELTLNGCDALCVDPQHGFFREGHPDSYKILCKVSAAWIGADDLALKLLDVAQGVNTDQTNALLEHGSMVGHFLLRNLEYRMLDDGAPEVAASLRYYLVAEDGTYQTVKGPAGGTGR